VGKKEGIIRDFKIYIIQKIFSELSDKDSWYILGIHKAYEKETQDFGGKP